MRSRRAPPPAPPSARCPPPTTTNAAPRAKERSFTLDPILAAFIVTGRDRQTWLNGLVTCELAARKPGDGVYGLAVGKTGKILAELWFVIAADHVAVLIAKDRLAMMREHLERHLIMEDVEVTDAPSRAVFFAFGPLANDLVDAARAHGADAAMVDFTGRRDAAAILAQDGGAESLRDALRVPAGDKGTLATDAAWEALRIEWGVPRFGVDFDDQTLPQEASLERLAVSFNKGCYLGQETVFMLEKRGHAKKRLMRIAIDGQASVPVGSEIALPDGTVVGSLTSQAWSSGGVVALGYVKYKHATDGATVTVAGRTARVIGLAAEPAAL